MTAPARFKQADVKRAGAGALSLGLTIARIEIEPNGKIVIIPGEPDPNAGNDNEWADLE